MFNGQAPQMGRDEFEGLVRELALRAPGGRITAAFFGASEAISCSPEELRLLLERLGHAGGTVECRLSIVVGPGQRSGEGEVLS